METVMVKTIVAGCTAMLTALALWACNDKIDVQQAYPFQLTSCGIYPNRQHKRKTVRPV